MFSRVELVIDWARWFVTRLLEHYPTPPVVTVRLGWFPKGDPTIAMWSTHDELTLGLNHTQTWTEPFGEGTFQTLIHEAAHHRNAHHGSKFSEEVEVLAGVAASVLMNHHSDIMAKFGALHN